jgi:hypothetical protein
VHDGTPSDHAGGLSIGEIVALHALYARATMLASV